MGEAWFEVVGDVARFRLTGEHELEDAVRQIADAIARTKASGLDKLLVDISRISGIEPPGIASRHWMMGEWAREGRSSVRAAMVARAEFIDPDRFGIIAGMNSGFISNVFEDEDRALAWLQGRRGRSPREPSKSTQ
jgi:hypothetical protein